MSNGPKAFKSQVDMNLKLRSPPNNRPHPHNGHQPKTLSSNNASECSLRTATASQDRLAFALTAAAIYRDSYIAPPSWPPQLIVAPCAFVCTKGFESQRNCAAPNRHQHFWAERGYCAGGQPPYHRISNSRIKEWLQWSKYNESFREQPENKIETKKKGG